MSYLALEKAIEEKKNIYVFGAGIVACGAIKAIRFIYDVSIYACLVTSKDGNPERVLDIPIVELKCLSDSNAWILISVPEQYHSEIAKDLEKHGFFQYSFLDSDAEYELMSEYLKRQYGLKLIEDIQVDKKETDELDIDDVFLGMATSIFDKKLVKAYEEPVWVKKIQAGSALTNDKIAPFRDDGDDSISEENPIYGELTVTYFMWKNIRKKVMGLYHYRRVLEVDERALYLLNKEEIDVILPLPYVCENVTKDQFGRYLSDEDIRIMMNVLREKHPESYEQIEWILRGECLYNYNILVAREEVFTDYCNWMFPLLAEIDARCIITDSIRLTRYIGRIGEVLTSVYFSLNKRKWKIAHAKKIWRA